MPTESQVAVGSLGYVGVLNRRNQHGLPISARSKDWRMVNSSTQMDGIALVYAIGALKQSYGAMNRC